jgi:hypothetical protein
MSTKNDDETSAAAVSTHFDTQVFKLNSDAAVTVIHSRCKNSPCLLFFFFFFFCFFFFFVALFVFSSLFVCFY